MLPIIKAIITITIYLKQALVNAEGTGIETITAANNNNTYQQQRSFVLLAKQCVPVCGFGKS